MHEYLKADSIEKQLRLNGRKKAIQRQPGNRSNSAKKQARKP
jgi:hypothetical protein